LIRIIPATLAAMGIIICQIHGGPFWVFIMAGNLWLGWSISILWEGMSVWLWWEGARWFWKWIPTAFLLFGMVFQSVSPMMDDMERAETAVITQGKAQGTLDKLMEAIVDQGRKGFKDTMDTLIEKSFTAPSMNTGVKTAPIMALPWLPIIPLVGFPVIYIISLLFVSGLRERISVVKKQPETQGERLAAKLKTEILKRLDEQGMTYRKLGTELNVPPPVLNNIVRRKENQAEGRTVIGINRMLEIEKKIKV
jgi:hypothetical protein